MRKFRKDYNIKIVIFVISVSYLFSNLLYASNVTSLRKPLSANLDEDLGRLRQVERAVQVLLDGKKALQLRFPIDIGNLPNFKSFIFRKGTTYGSRWNWMNGKLYTDPLYFHTGVDIFEYRTTSKESVSIRNDVPIKACISGTVILGKGPYSDIVMIYSQKKQMIVLLIHLRALVTPGTEVKEGDIIGEFRDNTFLDPHLHLEILKGDFNFPVPIGDTKLNHKNIFGYIRSLRSTYSVDPFLIWSGLLESSDIEADDTNPMLGILTEALRRFKKLKSFL